MQTHNLIPRTYNKKRMIVARGGKRGKTSGRGGKGQTARAGNKRRPELRDLIKKIPKLRGRGKSSFKSYQEDNIPVNIDALEIAFASGALVTPMSLLEAGLIEMQSGKIPPVKILGVGAITKKMTVQGCTVSAGAKAAIEKAGGKVE